MMAIKPVVSKRVGILVPSGGFRAKRIYGPSSNKMLTILSREIEFFSFPQ